MKRRIIMIGLIVLTFATTSRAQIKSDSSQKYEAKIRKSNPDGKVGIIFLDIDATIYESSDVSYKQGGGQTFMPTGFGHNKFSIGFGVPILKTLTLFGGFQRLSSTTKSDFGNWNYKVTSNAIIIKGRFYLDFN